MEKKIQCDKCKLKFDKKEIVIKYDYEKCVGVCKDCGKVYYNDVGYYND
jgi:uncharacterized Zn finger protein